MLIRLMMFRLLTVCLNTILPKDDFAKYDDGDADADSDDADIILFIA